MAISHVFLFFGPDAGLKKVMWPMFIGLQVVKTMLLAMFLPSIIGSLGKIFGKGELAATLRIWRR